MSGSGWNVLRCSACNTCHGHRGTGNSCPHCGQKMGQNPSIVCTVQTAAELRIEVALANTPEELRTSLRKRLVKNEQLFQSEDDVSFTGLPQILHRAADEDGVFTMKQLEPVLKKSGQSLEVQDLIDIAESQGLLVRLDANRWQVLE
ncbi:hypothetical protein N9N18_03375 [Euryarchaeota archaeon]|nr:hypothetical protein [Euryarchaeota archaeon]MDA8700774.1 hypothetical protein [Euryarchaeota archaeon]MDA8843157.1 hypothetical protein [Euryarchaeota archaeon]